MDIQQGVADIEAATPYVWEILSIVSIFVSLTITQWFKKRRFFPKFLCNIKLSKPRPGKAQFEYKQLKPSYLDTLAVIQTFIYVSVCLYIRYEALPVLI